MQKFYTVFPGTSKFETYEEAEKAAKKMVVPQIASPDLYGRQRVKAAVDEAYICQAIAVAAAPMPAVEITKIS